MESCEIVARTDALFQELKKYPENSKEYREIESEIVKINIRLVTYFAKGFFRSCGPTLDSDDLISEGYVALVKAVRTFKLEKEIAFSTYAGQCIKNAIFHCLKQEPKANQMSSLEENIETSYYDYKLKYKDVLASPVNIEEDIAEKDETNRQMAWVRKNLDQLPPLQKRVLISRYLSGETMLKTQEALAKEFGCTQQNIFDATNRAIKKLRKMYDETHPEEIELKEEIEEKIKLKEVLKNLIATELAPMKKKTMLCKFYSPTQKTNEQVAEEIGSTQQNVSAYISQSSKKLCTLCNSIKDTKHLKNILEFRVAESGKGY